MKEAILVAGSNGAIGKAVCEAILAEGNYKLLTVSRTAAHFSGAEHLTADLSDPESLPAVKSWLDGMREDLAGVIHCAGLLHNSRVKPEKALSQLRLNHWQNVYLRMCCPMFTLLRLLSTNSAKMTPLGGFR